LGGGHWLVAVRSKHSYYKPSYYKPSIRGPAPAELGRGTLWLG
jgi:hypothetical protein